MEHYNGDTFTPADMNVIRRALQVYFEQMLTDPLETNQTDLNAAANLQHRLGRIKKEVKC